MDSLKLVETKLSKEINQADDKMIDRLEKSFKEANNRIN